MMLFNSIWSASVKQKVLSMFLIQEHRWQLQLRAHSSEGSAHLRLSYPDSITLVDPHWQFVNWIVLSTPLRACLWGHRSISTAEASKPCIVTASSSRRPQWSTTKKLPYLQSPAFCPCTQTTNLLLQVMKMKIKMFIFHHRSISLLFHLITF